MQKWKLLKHWQYGSSSSHDLSLLPVRGQYNTPPLSDDAGQGVPEKPPGGRVHSCRWLIQEEDGRVTN